MSAFLRKGQAPHPYWKLANELYELGYSEGGFDRDEDARWARYEHEKFVKLLHKEELVPGSKQTELDLFIESLLATAPDVGNDLDTFRFLCDRLRGTPRQEEKTLF